jgi:uncharacterized protein YecE (DUF72 family)
MSQFFDVLEINNTFYRPPSPQNCESWVRRTSHNKRFMFTVKLHQKFTHEREGITPEDEVVFKKGIEPIDDAGCLGCILMQFPWSFKYLPSNRRYLAELVEKFKDYPLVLEVRNAAWDNKELYSFLAEKGVGFCNIDQPRFRSPSATFGCTARTSRTGSRRMPAGTSDTITSTAWTNWTRG